MADDETVEPEPGMQIALIAHDGKKDELLALVAEQLRVLRRVRRLSHPARHERDHGGPLPRRTCPARVPGSLGLSRLRCLMLCSAASHNVPPGTRVP
jgi:hypothetical protein